MNISKLSVKRPVAVTMVVMILVVIGLYSLSMFSIELMPDMELSMAVVYTQYPNVGSEEVENMVTKTIEGAVSAVSGAKSVTSQSSEGSSMVMVEFAASTDMDKAVRDISDQIELVESYLPEDAEEPMVLKLDMSMMPIAMMSVSYEGMDPIRTKKYVEDNVQNKLEAVAGVASVTVSGAQDRIIEIKVKPEQLFGQGVGLSDIRNAIASQNTNLPAGSINHRGKELNLRAVGKFSKIEEISGVPLLNDKGQIIYIRDVADVTDTFSEASSISRLNGETSLSIAITAESDANTVDVVNSVKEALEDIKSQNKKFSYNMTMEQASYIEKSVSSVAESAGIGAILAIIILLLFLGNFKTSMVVGISMPISVIVTFIGMHFAGMTLNVVSLGGLCLGVGMLVDNSVVVIENIFRRRNELSEDGETSAIKGTSEVIGAIVASVITTCIVYVPILFIDNIMAVMFKQLAFAIICSQCASLLVTFKSDMNKAFSFILVPFSKFMDKCYGLYEKSLRKVLSAKKTFLTVIMVVFAASLVVLGIIGMTLMPESDEGTLTVNIELPDGSKLEKNNNITMEIEEIISDNKDVDSVFANVGSGSMSMFGQTSSNASSVTVTLKDDRKSSTEEVAQQLREDLGEIAGAIVTVSASSSMGMSSNEIEFNFSGKDDEELEAYVLEVQEILDDIEGIVETETSISDTKSEMRIKIDSGRAARYGMSTSTVANAVNAVLSGSSAGKYAEKGMEYDIDIVYPETYANSIIALNNMQMKTPAGQWVSLSDVAEVYEDRGYATLTRIDQKRVITLTGKIFNSDIGSINKAFNEKIKSIRVPDGISRETGGTFEVMMDAMKSLLIAILLGILLMYMAMAAQFESLKQPFVILFTLPLAMIGVTLSLVIFGMPLSVVACIGILMLTGIVVNNAIVLIDFVNTAKIENPDMDKTEILVYAGKTRMRPVLMTSLTSILGFMPMAIAVGSSGSAMMQPLAVVLVGGLTVGTFLTLLVIPVVYAIFDETGTKKKRKRQRRQRPQITNITPDEQEGFFTDSNL